jgi:hypothetical protein
VNMDEKPKERADIATRFQKGNEIWKLVQRNGRPETWTQEAVDELSSKLIEWIDKEDSIVMCGFTSENYITFDTVMYLCSRYPDFADLYKSAKAKVATKLAQKLGKQVHPAHYNRYQAVYDAELKHHEKEMANVKAEQISEQQRDAELRALEISAKIAEQMKAHLDKGKS